MAKSATKSITSPAKSVSNSDKDTRRANDENQGRNAINLESDKPVEPIQEPATSTKSTTRKRKSGAPNNKQQQQQQENRISMESKTEPKSDVSSAPSLFTKNEPVECTKDKSPFENRPTAEESSEPSKLSPSKREANERLKPIEAKSSVQSLEQEIKERKAECQATNVTNTGNKSKLSDALDKLVYKQKEKQEQQQQQKQLQKTEKQFKRTPQRMEANKSPIDMEIEPKESNERDEIIDVVKDNRSKCPAQNDLQNQNVVNEVGRLATDSSNPSDSTGDIDQLRFGTDKYEQEQFVNNMPKPPTPKSSLIFSPPPTSLTIDKREASIFDFDNFPMPNDSSVSLLSFNSDNLFKEDSAKETMDLVANLRQNIKKGGKNEECSKAKSESLNQPQIIETEISPDSTTTDINLKSNTNESKSSQSIDSKSMAGIPQPTLVIDLDQENSGDESKLPQLDAQMNIKTSSKDSSNWSQNTQKDKDRGNPANVANLTSPLQLQTEVEQIASKLSNVIPTPSDFVICNDLNEGQNINAFNIQPYVCSAFNGNKETFDTQIETQVVSDLLFFTILSQKYF